MTRTRLYALLLTTWMAGMIWLAFNMQKPHDLGICLFKAVTDLPCPSCGSTRSVLCLLHGDLSNAWLINPLGYILFSGIIILPLWILFDLVARRQSLYRTYLRMESWLKKPQAFIPFACFIALNWIWNIAKGL